MWACFIVFSPQEGMMHIIICSTREHLFGHQRKQKKIKDKNPDQCPVERVRPSLGGFYVQLKFYSSSKF